MTVVMEMVVVRTPPEPNRNFSLQSALMLLSWVRTIVRSRRGRAILVPLQLLIHALSAVIKVGPTWH